jgi:hypothetical protein
MRLYLSKELPVSRKFHLKRLSRWKTAEQLKEKGMRGRSLSKALPVCFIGTIITFGLIGKLPLLLLSVAAGVTIVSLITAKRTDQLLNRSAALVGGWNVLFVVLAVAIGISLLTHGQPAYALFDGAKAAASGGIGKYIGTDESTSLIDTITFGMWALAAVGGIATIAGGAVQNVMVLVGGLVLFFGMAVLIGVLEFTDGLLFST